ncbi:MAG: hypothetical protein V4635_07075 [Bacteroidota bacterium]
MKNFQPVQKIRFLLCLTVLSGFTAISQKKDYFFSRDSVKICYDEYFSSKKAPVILLCHRQGYSRGEYPEIAKKIKGLGYNCIAFDHRNGDTCNGVANETMRDAKSSKKLTTWARAETDIEDATIFFNNKYQKKLIVLGSGHSSSVILKLAKKDNSKIKALICFSPGEYSESYSLEQELKGLNTIALIYASNDEMKAVEQCTSGLLNRRTFHPLFSTGEYGASVLWNSSASSAEFWNDLYAQLGFLKKI